MHNPSYIYGLHDQEGAHLVPPGGWCVALVALSEDWQGKNYAAIRPDINWIIRINWGYGSTGTIPKRAQWGDYYSRLVAFLQNTQGAQHIIIGNEPNHEQERPDGQIIEPEDYGEFFVQAWHSASILSFPWLVGPAALAPYHANPIPWTLYAERMYQYILKRGVTPGFIPVHTYLRGSTPDAVWDKTLMGPPLQNTYYGFLGYYDAIQQIPSVWSHLPVHITECNEILPDGWVDEDTGVIEAAYEQINWHNEQVEDSNPVQSLSLYRYPRFDKWHLEGKNKTLQDFSDATQHRRRSPQTALDSTKGGVLMPSIKNDTKTPQKPATAFEIDSAKYPVERVRVTGNGDGGWVVKNVKFLDRDKSGGRHHAYVETLDENGNAISGTPFVFGWPAKEVSLKTNNRFGFDAANQQFSPGEGAFHVRLPGGPKVEGLGMGELTEHGFNPGEHTSFVVTFQRGAASGGDPDETQEMPVPENLRLPFNGDYPITQVFGVNEAYYKQFKYDGVPLKGHNGIDFGTPIRTPIFAIDGGVVIERGFDADGYGNYVKLRHTWGETLYAHLHTIEVGNGQMVTKGKLLGLSGNSGNSTGPHLHFGLRTFPYSRTDGWGGYKDPASFLPLDEEELPVEEEQPIEIANPTVRAAIGFAAEKYKQDPDLLASLAWAESSFRPYLKDGLFQISDITWGEWSKKAQVTDRNNPLHNALVGAAYFRHLLNYYQGNYYKALYAWNWGPGNVDSGKEPPAITKEFANKVLHGRDLLKAMES